MAWGYQPHAHKGRNAIILFNLTINYMTDSHTPRLPTETEKRELAELTLSYKNLGSTPENTAEELLFVEGAYIAVFDNYMADCPGYAGKLLSVVWSGSPDIHEVYTWENNRLRKEQHHLSQE